MRSFFIGFSFLTILLLIIFIQISFRQKKAISKFMSSIHVVTLFAIIFSIIPLLISNKVIAIIFTSLYYISIDWLLVVYLDFLFVFTETEFDIPLIRIFRTDVFILTLMDSILILSTVYTDFTFTLVPKIENDVFVGWIETRKSGFSIHSLLDYFISGIIGIFLIKKLIDSKKIHKQKILIMLCCFISLIIANIFLMSSQIQFRYTSLSYALVSLIVSELTFQVLPKKMAAKIKTLIAENISDAVVCFDLNGKCIFMNTIAKSIFGTEEKCYEKFVNYNALGFDQLNLRESFETKGELRTFDVISHRLRDNNNRKIGTYMTFSDVTYELERLKNEMYRSTHDSLTGLYNRSTFFKEVDAKLESEPNIPYYLVCTNIQNFKIINDLFGSKVGDRILKAKADILSELKIKNNLIGRISDDRFAMLIEKKSFDQEKLVQNIQKVQNYLEASKFKIEILIGIYEISDPYENVMLMYDKANLSIKKRGITQNVSFYDTSLMEHLIYEKKIIGMFDSALTSGQFKMYLQPQISSKTRTPVGAEALVRWLNPEQGMIPPGNFVPILENAGLIYRLDEFIWEEAAKKLAEWQEKGIDLYIAVNISAKDFYHLDLYKIFTRIVEKYKIKPQKLKLEITETVLMYDMKIHSQILKKLQDYGFFIEMDDFGSGYSSLNMLKNIKMDVLKIDMAFLKKTENPERSKIIINSIIKMAKNLGMMIITEGVEEEEHVEFLTKAGCDIFQGYFYSKPIFVEEFESKFIFNGALK